MRRPQSSNTLDNEGSEMNRRFLLLMELAARRAIHNPKDHYEPPKCHPNTRVAIMDRLMDWINGKTFPDTPLLWLYGPAGAGKSAIAQSLAEICEKQKLLLASFFFSTTDPTRNTVNPLAATIAYQITNVIPATAELIESAVDRKLFTELFETQLMKLVVQPLAEFAKQDAADSQFPRFIIIDAPTLYDYTPHDPPPQESEGVLSLSLSSMVSR